MKKIDTHMHYVPRFYKEAAVAAGFAHPDGSPDYPSWSEQGALDALDQLGIDTAMLSISSPGVNFGNDLASRGLARRVNEEGARLVADHPGRFGLFAALPLPDVEASLDEAAYAFDALKADGVVLLTNHRGTYLGDRRFDPLFAELDRRRAVIFIHPTSPCCPLCQSRGAQTVGLNFPRPMIEFMFETTRAVTNLILSGTLDRFPNLRVIVPHAGAALPVLADRVASLAPVLGLTEEKQPHHVFSHLRRFYYDLAGFPLPRLLPALLEVADPTRILYGSDFPFTPLTILKPLAKLFDDTPVLNESLRQLVYHENAVALFPQLERGAANLLLEGNLP